MTLEYGQTKMVLVDAGEHGMYAHYSDDRPVIESTYMDTGEHVYKSVEGKGLNTAGKDVYEIYGRAGEDGNLVVDKIRRLGDEVQAQTKELFAQEGLTPEEQNEKYLAMTEPESCQIAGVEFKVGAPMRGRVVDLEMAQSDEAHKLFADAEKYAQSLATGDAVGQKYSVNYNIADTARHAKRIEMMQPDYEFERRIAFGLDREGNLFSEERYSDDHMPGNNECVMKLGRDFAGEVVVTGLSHSVGSGEPQQHSEMSFLGNKFHVHQPVGDLTISQERTGYSDAQMEAAISTLTEMRHDYIRITGETPELKTPPTRERAVENSMDEGRA